MHRFFLYISKNGILEPIKYTVFNGQKFIVDGHHRLAAAKILSFPDVPAIEVNLPCAGYRNVYDLFW